AVLPVGTEHAKKDCPQSSCGQEPCRRCYRANRRPSHRRERPRASPACRTRNSGGRRFRRERLVLIYLGFFHPSEATLHPRPGGHQTTSEQSCSSAPTRSPRSSSSKSRILTANPRSEEHTS